MVGKGLERFETALIVGVRRVALDREHADRATLAASVRKTGRFLAVTEGPATCGVAAELVTIVNEEAFLNLAAPPARLAGFDTAPPYARGEHFYFHSPERIYYELKKVVDY